MAFDPAATRSGAIFSDNPLYQAAWVCYIHGKYVPIVGFDVECGVWKIPSFRIHLQPDILLQRIGHEDRVPVALFYLDYWYDPKKPEFRLLIDGEIIGWSYSSSAGQRTLSYSCVSTIHVFEQLYFHFMTNVDDVIAARSPDAVVQGFSTPGLIYPYALFHTGLLSTAAQIEETTSRQGEVETPGTTAEEAPGAEVIKAPYEFAYNLIKGCISSKVPDTRRAVPMMNFFARHIRKTRLDKRFVRLPILEDPARLAEGGGVFPIFRAARNLEALNAMQRHVSSQVGNSGPVWNLIEKVFGLVNMEMGMINNPCSVLVQLKDTSGGLTPVDGRIIDYPRYDTEQTDQRPAPAAPVASTTAGADVITPANPTARGHEFGISPLTPVRLAQYFAKPQMFFSNAPHCNVIFPSMVEGWTYDENFLSQPTRTYVNDSVMTQLLRADGPNREFMLHALMVGSPEEANAILHHKVGASQHATGAAAPTESGKNILIWPEECFKGPVLARAEVPAWFQMLRQFTNAQAGTPGTPGAPGTPGIPGGGGGSAPLPIAIPTTPPSNAETPTVLLPTQGSSQRLFPRRVTVGRTTVVAINPEYYIGRGKSSALLHRLRLQYGSGLDPDMYLPAERTGLWPLDIRAIPHDRRGHRLPQQARGGEHREDSVKLAQVVRLIRPLVAGHVSGLTDLQVVALSFSFAYLVITEGNLRSMLNWAWGNARQYTTSGRRHWTINPGDGLSYIAATSAQEGAASWVNVTFNSDKFRRAIEITINGRPPPDLAALFATLDTPERRRAFAPLGAMRPDYFYPMLGYGGWYAEEHVADPVQRTQIGISRSLPFLGYYTRTIAAILANRVPADVIIRIPLGAPAQPASADDLAFIRAQGGRQVSSTTVSRPIRRIAPNPAAPLPGTGGTGAPVPTTIGGVAAPASEEDENSFARLFTLYAQQEHMRARYAQRGAGARLKFNPYLVVGFPSFIWDSMAVRMHVVGYMQGFGHSGSVGANGSCNLSSQAQLAYCRTFYEFLADVKADAARFSGRVTSAPAELISEIREVTQDEVNAETFYSRLLYGGRPSKAGAAFRWTEAMGLADGLNSHEVEITGDSVAVVERRLRASENAANATANEQDTAGAENTQPTPANAEQSAQRQGVSSETQTTVRTTIDPNREYSPRNNIYSDAFTSYQTAMELASRPACTLDEYVRFWHGGKSIGVLRHNGQVGQEMNDFAYTTERVSDVVSESANVSGQATLQRGMTTRATAAFYSHIFKLRPGPGTGRDRLDEPGAEERGYTDPPNIQPAAVTRGFPADYPQTRADWDVALDAYVEKLRNRVRPST